jgi:GNAT superfamily N-acetyltransferase
MTPEPFLTTDIPAFLAAASGENWVVERWELVFLLEAFPAGCRVVRTETGAPCGFVTSCIHHASGWIGNLVVAPEYRGQGVGEQLFCDALRSLCAAEMATVWLTASEAGSGIYKKHGFKTIDTILRWTGFSGRDGDNGGYEIPPPAENSRAFSLDSRAWGDRRELLVSTVMERGTSLIVDDGFITLQPYGDMFQIGPFVALDEQTAGKLLNGALSLAPEGRRICLDAPVSNRAGVNHFSSMSMTVAGSNELMYFGKRPEYHPELLYGLASMGSCG